MLRKRPFRANGSGAGPLAPAAHAAAPGGLRRADKLFAATPAVDDRAATGLATEVRTAIEQLVHYLPRLEQQRERQAREALRRSR